MQVLNPRRRGAFALLRWLLWLSWLCFEALLLLGCAAYVYFSQDLPPLETLVHFRPAQGSMAYFSDGFLMARFAREHRRVLPPEAIPLRVRQAFLAAEDADFYSHGGIDLAGVARAAWHMLRRRSGRPRQGGSTITQQLAKTLIGTEKTLARKAREAVLARRLEASLSKDQILWTYLNNVYLGRRAYGVGAAARIYFGRELEELGPGQMAYLAGLLQRPSVLGRDHEAALARARYVLDQMVARGWLSREERRQALEDGIEPGPYQDPAVWRAPYAAEAVRRRLLDLVGEEKLYGGDLLVETSVVLPEQAAAREALMRGLQAIDRRQGFRGPAASLDPEAAARLQRMWQERGGFTAGPDGLMPALVLEPRRDVLRLLAGDVHLELPLAACRWARPYDEEARSNRGRLRDFRKILRAGDIVVLRLLPGQEPFFVPFLPGLQGAVLLREVGTGYLRAMVGGRDADISVFDRALQACRQPGSVFKPVYYSAALARGFTPATVITDAPLRLAQEGSLFAYRARNVDRRFCGDMILANALARSRNIPSLKIFRFVGAPETLRWARELGVKSPLAPVDALALGASCVRPAEMLGLYALFADRGRPRASVLIRKIVDSEGRTLLDRRHPSDPGLRADEALRHMLDYRPSPRPRGMSEELAYLGAALLRGVVERGTARKALGLSHPVAGKTGTTDHYDAWFIGFSAQRVAAVWVGPDDNRRVLGKGEHGGKVALPVFMELMERVHRELPARQIPGEAPPGVEIVAIDPKSGCRAGPGTSAIDLPFLVGTAPGEQASAEGSFGKLDVDRMGGRF